MRGTEVTVLSLSLSQVIKGRCGGGGMGQAEGVGQKAKGKAGRQEKWWGTGPVPVLPVLSFQKSGREVGGGGMCVCGRCSEFSVRHWVGKE